MIKLPNIDLPTETQEAPLDLGKELWSKRKHRQQADFFLQSLENRVQMLRNEEEKLWHKIMHDQMAANKVVQLKKDNRDYNLKKSIMKSGSEAQLRQMQAEHQRTRLIRYDVKDKMSQAKQMMSHDQYLSIKKSSDLNDQQIMTQRNEHTILKKLKGNEVKRMKLQAHLNVQKYFEEKELNKKKNYLDEIKKEEVNATDKQDKIKRLEEEETRLFERLKNTKTLSQDVQVSLQDIKNTHSKDIMHKIQSMHHLNQLINQNKKNKSKYSSVQQDKSINYFSAHNRPRVTEESFSEIYQGANNDISILIEKKKKTRKSKSKIRH